jgi:hypothetical protein
VHSLFLSFLPFRKKGHVKISLCYRRTSFNIIIVAVTKLHASRPRKVFTPLPRGAHQYSVAIFATLRVLRCLHSPGLRCSCCNVVRFCCDLESCNLVRATIRSAELQRWKYKLEVLAALNE